MTPELRAAIERAHTATQDALDLAYREPRARLRDRLALGKAQNILIKLLTRVRR